MDQNGGPRLIILSVVIRVLQAVTMILITNLKLMGPGFLSLMIHLVYYCHLKRRMKTNKPIIILRKKCLKLYYQ